MCIRDSYDAAYVRLKAKGSAGKELSITELDILGPSGDSIRFGVEESNRNSAVGILAKEYEYDLSLIHISIGKEELHSMIEEGEPIEVNCHFCGKNYVFDVDALRAMEKKAGR